MEQNKENHFTDRQADAFLAWVNDDKMLGEFYAANFYKTEAFVIANSGTAEEAKDIYQDAFTAMWQNIKVGRFAARNDSSLEAYLFQIAKFKWYDHLKAAKKITVVPMEEIYIAEEIYNKEEEVYINNVQHHFKSLGEPCKQVLTWFYYMKKSMAEIAAAFSWTEATAKNNKYRCLQRLRNMVVGKQ